MIEYSSEAKMRKKYFIFILFVGLLLVGCTNSKVTDNQLLNDFVTSLSFEDNLSENLDFSTSYMWEGTEIEASWESSNSDIISNDGVVCVTVENEIVSVLGTFTLNDNMQEKTFEFVTEASGIEAMLEEAKTKVYLPSQINEDIELEKNLVYSIYHIYIDWESSDTNILDISSKGDVAEINYATTDRDVTLTATLNYKSVSLNTELDIEILKYDTTELENKLSAIDIPVYLTNSFEFPSELTLENTTYLIDWISSDTTKLSNDGEIHPTTEDINVSMTANITFDDISISHTFNTSVAAVSDTYLLQSALESLDIPAKLTASITLPTSLENEITATWTSSNTSLLSNNGIINNNIASYTNITLSVTLEKDGTTMEKQYNIMVGTEDHMFMDRNFMGEKENLVIEEQKLVLASNALEGTYYTDEIETSEFQSVVPSWAATSSTSATCELAISIRCNDVWSKYLSYNEWGLGLDNTLIDQSDEFVEFSEDITKMVAGNYGDAFKMKITLRRDSLNDASPEVSLIALAINFKDLTYDYDVDISNLEKHVDYDVPKLYQQDVPDIGNSICSATSSTMLLMYKVHEFEDELPHRYVASLVYDYGNEIYGNWVYNTVTMGAFGEDSYVKRFYSINELLTSLATLGPMAASVKGYVINDVYSYNTAGHLLVVRGYDIDDDGNITMIINDPNVSTTLCHMTLENFQNIWRNVSYIVE